MKNPHFNTLEDAIVFFEKKTGEPSVRLVKWKVSNKEITIGPQKDLAVKPKSVM